MKVGDRVMILNEESAFYLMKGVIEEIDDHVIYPVQVKFEDDDCPFAEKELKVIS